MTCVFGAPAERGSRRAGDGLQCWSDKVTIDGASVAQAQRAFVRFVADCASRWARTAVVVTRGKLSSFVGSRLCVKFSVAHRIHRKFRQSDPGIHAAPYQTSRRPTKRVGM